MLNDLLTPENVMWAAAAASFVLLLLSAPISRALASARHDGVVRLVKIAVYIALPLLVLFPALLLISGEAVPGVPCAFYLVFFALFCYCLGRATGTAKGGREMSDRVGLEQFDSIAEVQDRLYESRQRHATHGEIERSITELAAAAAKGNAAESKAGRTSAAILDVVVEVEEIECANSSVG